MKENQIPSKNSLYNLQIMFYEVDSKFFFKKSHQLIYYHLYLRIF